MCGLGNEELLTVLLTYSNRGYYDRKSVLSGRGKIVKKLWLISVIIWRWGDNINGRFGWGLRQFSVSQASAQRQNERWMGKYLEGSGHRLIEVLSRNLPRLTEKPPENFRISGVRTRDSNWKPPKYNLFGDNIKVRPRLRMSFDNVSSSDLERSGLNGGLSCKWCRTFRRV